MEYIVYNLVDDGDRIVCVRIIDKDSDLGKRIKKKKVEYKRELDMIENQMKRMLTDNGGPAIAVVVKMAIGKVGPKLISDLVISTYARHKKNH